MAKKITAKEVKRKLRRIVNLKGHEYVYEHPTYEDEYGDIKESIECHYTDRSGKPSCIVGALLSEVAPGELKKLHSHEWEYRYEPRAVTTLELVGENPTGVDLSELFEEDALQLVHRVQRSQDYGNSWGESLDSAIKS